MLFTLKAKNELARREPDCENCRIAELAALIKTEGSIEIASRGRVSLVTTVDSPAVARRLFRFIRDLFNLHAEIIVKKGSRLRRGSLYMVRIPASDKSMDVIKAVGAISVNGELPRGLPWHLVHSNCCRRSYLRGAFLSHGYISDPTGGYHLEMSVENGEYAEDLKKLIGRFNIKSRITEHKHKYIVYMKGAEDISRFLQVIGADTSMLNLENIRIMKSVRNNVNRAVNCETANMNKTVDAAKRQIDDIKLIEDTIGIAALPENIGEVAKARLEMPAATMEEIGESLSRKISKSSVGYRFRKLARIADELRESVK